MVAMLYHSGPDYSGFHTDNNVGLAHARLSITDINGGYQPIHDHNRNTCIIVNREIFNYIELRNELIKDGISFRMSYYSDI